MSRLEKLINALKEKDFDAAIVSSQTSQRYLSDFAYSDGYILVADQKAYLLTDFRYEEAAKEKADKRFEILCPDCGMLVCIAGLLAENGCKRVAIEEKSVSLSELERFQKALPEVELAGGASAMLEELRVFKDEDELAIMEAAQKITDAAFAHILSQMTPTMTETDVALELEFFMRRNGADAIAFDTIAVSGSASSLPHGVPRRVPLEKGFLTMDFGAKLGGYCSDMTRTVVIGKADEEMKKLYNTVLAAQTAALDAAKEGASCYTLDKVARDLIEGAGYHKRFGHSLGHGVGLAIHEAPRLASSASPDVKLLRGHVVTVEPGIYITGKYGCRIEDMIAIRPDGTFFNFTHSPKELIELF